MCEYYNQLKDMQPNTTEQEMLILLAEQLKSTKENTEQKIANTVLQIEHLNNNIKQSFESLGKELQYINQNISDLKQKQKEDINDLYDDIDELSHIECPQGLDTKVEKLTNSVEKLTNKVNENIDFIIVIKKYKIIAILIVLGIANIIYNYISKEDGTQSKPNIIEVVK